MRPLLPLAVLPVLLLAACHSRIKHVEAVEPVAFPRNVSIELEPQGYNERRAVAKIENIYNALKKIFETTRAEGVTPVQAADRVAEQRLTEARARRGIPDPATP